MQWKSEHAHTHSNSTKYTQLPAFWTQPSTHPQQSTGWINDFSGRLVPLQSVYINILWGDPWWCMNINRTLLQHACTSFILSSPSPQPSSQEQPSLIVHVYINTFQLHLCRVKIETCYAVLWTVCCSSSSSMCWIGLLLPDQGSTQNPFQLTRG